LRSVDIDSEHSTPQSSPNKKTKKIRTWQESFELLKQYKEIYGNCNVPDKWKDDRSLARWVGRQRGLHLTMKEERRAALDAIGFDWNPLETAWQQQYQKLVKYKEEHGDCNVPEGWKKDPTLAKWVATQRSIKSKAYG
jgi:hypothetical protein